MSYGSGERSFFGLGGRNRYGGRYPLAAAIVNIALPEAFQKTSVLERSIREVTDQLKNDSLPARTYVAVVETSPEMELGTSAAREEGSFHIVVGKW